VSVALETNGYSAAGELWHVDGEMLTHGEHVSRAVLQLVTQLELVVERNAARSICPLDGCLVIGVERCPACVVRYSSDRAS
jgi:hypothetical protein